MKSEPKQTVTVVLGHIKILLVAKSQKWLRSTSLLHHLPPVTGGQSRTQFTWGDLAVSAWLTRGDLLFRSKPKASGGSVTGH